MVLGGLQVLNMSIMELLCIKSVSDTYNDIWSAWMDERYLDFQPFVIFS